MTTLYIVLGALFIFIMIVIFRDDHDEYSGSYNKGGEPKRRRIVPPVQRAQTFQAAPKVESVVKNVPDKKEKVQNLERKSLSWSYLYRIDYDEDLEQETMETEIVGMNYYISESDIGLVNGTVQSEPNNPHDHRAQLVLRSDGKKLGYIPRRDLDDYEDFNEDDVVCPFAGEITMDDNGFFHADILVALPESRDFVKEELSYYVGEDDL